MNPATKREPGLEAEEKARWIAELKTQRDDELLFMAESLAAEMRRRRPADGFELCDCGDQVFGPHTKKAHGPTLLWEIAGGTAKVNPR